MRITLGCKMHNRNRLNVLIYFIMSSSAGMCITGSEIEIRNMNNYNQLNEMSKSAMVAKSKLFQVSPWMKGKEMMISSSSHEDKT